MGVGYITCSTHTADDALPIENCRVLIKNKQGVVLYDALTNANGYTDNFYLQSPDKELTLDSDYHEPAYSVYDVEALKDGYSPIVVHDVQIVDTIDSYLTLQMHPIVVDDEEFVISENGLLIDEPERQVGSNASSFREVFIPEYITVHLGAPTNSSASNVRVRFSDYVKNVASSEIYPTWPHNSLVSNIHCIVTFALNRVYTEWYRSRGFNFDITNSTAYDQYFVNGRNIYQNISDIVDEVFDTYARRFAFRNPFFTQYCNGTTTTCNGLSQWGTVDLANKGFTPIQILRHYFVSDIELSRSDNVQAITQSYPGYALRTGMSGEAVRRMQTYLNRIRINYPLINQMQPDGVFGAQTETAVRTFQRTFNLTPDGVIGKQTWNKITLIYVGVIRLAELDSEGERVTIGQTPPSAVLRQGSRGEDVLELQFILNVVAQYYNTVPPVIKDGYFGADTKNSVIEFQKNFGLTGDGVVGAATWNMLYDVYRSIEEGVKVPPAPEVAPSSPVYPGTPLRVGSSGVDVRTMQAFLNTIRIVYNSIPQLVVDGMFGERTREAVVAFQREFVLTPDGIIGEITWNEIVKQFNLVTGASSVSLEFSGRNLTVGSRGSDVRLMQTFLSELRSAYPTLPYVAIDGNFGAQTRGAVLAFQTMFGLTPDGIIGPITWDRIVAERQKI